MASLEVPLGLLAFESLLRLPGSNQHFWLADHHVHPHRQHRPDEGGNDKQPELAERSATHKERRANAPRRVHRGVGHGNPHQMDQH
jgi:hypothetical protein